MDTRTLETFAQDARRQLHEQVAAKLERVLSADTGELRAKAAMIQELKRHIEATSREEVVERVAYTWFNRFCALRYMDVNHYTRMGTVSPRTSPTGEAFTQPEILQEAKQGYVDPSWQGTIEEATVVGLLDGRLPSDDPQQEAYRLLLVGVCNAYHDVMPFMFEEIDDYTELLMPDDLLSEGSILQAVRGALTEANCRDVEVIGWLYQFYISEKKDAVMGRRGKVPSEDIPAVTQLFTPHWIVRYMVENSLGRLWMRNHPESRLVEQMEYYISDQWSVDSGQSGTDSDQLSVTSDQADRDHRPPTPDDYLHIDSPEEIRLCDPACGSGHILTYAFDLLYAIYEEQGYNPVDIPQLILEKNLTGIEIDPRAGALAGFALMMKALAADRRFFRRGVQPDICVMEDVSFTQQELDTYMDAVERDLLTQDVEDWLQQFEQATTFGSLIRPKVTDTAFIEEHLTEVGAFQNLFLSKTHENLQHVLEMTEALSLDYHVVVANPPYMGSRSMSRELKHFAKDHYPDSKRDLCTMFIERNLELVQSRGLVGMITMMSWMFLSSFEDLRKHILEQEKIETMVHLGPRAFDTISGEVVSTTMFTLRRVADMDYEGQYFRLIDGDSESEKAQMLLNDLRTDNWQMTTNYFRASAADFEKIPGAPIAYWVSKQFFEVFSNPNIDVISDFTGSQNITASNAKYLRYWFELEYSKIRERWFFYSKGGEYRKYYGNLLWCVDWSESARKFYAENTTSNLLDRKYWFREGIAYTDITSKGFSCRYLPEGCLYDKAGPAFHPETDIEKLLCMLNTKPVNYTLSVLNPTYHCQVRDLKAIPVPSETFELDSGKCNQAVAIARKDWNAYETSENFTASPLFALDLGAQNKSELESELLRKSYVELRARWSLLAQELQYIEQENNDILTDAYGLRDKLAPAVPLSEITVTCNPHYRYGSSSLKTRNWSNFRERFPETCQRLDEISAEMVAEMPEEDRIGLEQKLLDDTMREFISYAVGCMFGRYSLDKPGLILANQGETLDDYLRHVPAPTFMPDADNVIPMLDGDWFADDIAERFKQFLRVTFGEEHYEENLAFIELALNRDIRGYFLRNFYKDHLKRYSKRPIYWLFSSSEGSFNALIYMHRYQPDAVSIVLNDYLREFRTKLTARRRHLEAVDRSADATRRDRTQALKGIDKIDKILNELREYEDETLYPLAGAQVEIDLDDGVAVNYPKFGKALAHVRGLS
jgi:type II restriction/modification system DNA methylase subunit YeeA